MADIRKPGSSKSDSKKRISDSLLKHLNDQIKVEAEAAQIYYAMHEWCENKGYFGMASMLRKHSAEERDHMSKVYKYIADRDAEAITPSLEAPKKQSFSGIKDVLEVAYEHEIFVTSTYNSLADMALGEKDYMTFYWALDFLEEQREEEAKFKGMIDEVNVIGGDSKELYLFDQRLRDMGCDGPCGSKY